VTGTHEKLKTEFCTTKHQNLSHYVKSVD